MPGTMRTATEASSARTAQSAALSVRRSISVPSQRTQVGMGLRYPHRGFIHTLLTCPRGPKAACRFAGTPFGYSGQCMCGVGQTLIENASIASGHPEKPRIGGRPQKTAFGPPSPRTARTDNWSLASAPPQGRPMVALDGHVTGPRATTGSPERQRPSLRVSQVSENIQQASHPPQTL